MKGYSTPLIFYLIVVRIWHTGILFCFMPNTKKNAHPLQRSASATFSHATAKISLSNFSNSEIVCALDASNILCGVNLIDEMHEKFKGAVSHLVNAQASGNLDPKTIADEVFSIYYQPFDFLYHLLKAK